MGRDDECYDDVLDLYGCYLIYVCIRDPFRAREMDTRKEAKQRRKETMSTVSLLEFSGIGRQR